MPRPSRASDAIMKSRGPGSSAGLPGRVARSTTWRSGSIVRAASCALFSRPSGCFYAVRRELHKELVPDELSRDFIVAFNARQLSYRAVSVPDAVALVPRSNSLITEYNRKIRTMARGLDSLLHMYRLLNPIRQRRFAWMLASYKLARWLVPALFPAALVGIGMLTVGSHPVAVALVSPLGGAIVEGIGSVRRVGSP